MLFHHGQVHRVARGKASVPEDDLLGALDDGAIHGENFIDDAKQGIECRLNRVAAVESNVAMQYLLQHFGIGDQALALAQQLLDPSLRVDLVRMGGAHQVHGNIGINQNHDYRSAR